MDRAKRLRLSDEEVSLHPTPTHLIDQGAHKLNAHVSTMDASTSARQSSIGIDAWSSSPLLSRSSSSVPLPSPSITGTSLMTRLSLDLESLALHYIPLSQVVIMRLVSRHRRRRLIDYLRTTSTLTVDSFTLPICYYVLTTLPRRLREIGFAPSDYQSSPLVTEPSQPDKVTSYQCSLVELIDANRSSLQVPFFLRSVLARPGIF
jgi:hypothetical protein